MSDEIREVTESEKNSEPVTTIDKAKLFKVAVEAIVNKMVIHLYGLNFAVEDYQKIAEEIFNFRNGESEQITLENASGNVVFSRSLNEDGLIERIIVRITPSEIYNKFDNNVMASAIKKAKNDVAIIINKIEKKEAEKKEAEKKAAEKKAEEEEKVKEQAEKEAKKAEFEKEVEEKEASLPISQKITFSIEIDTKKNDENSEIVFNLKQKQTLLSITQSK